jgi:hypothetical protein
VGDLDADVRIVDRNKRTNVLLLLVPNHLRFRSISRGGRRLSLDRLNARIVVLMRRGGLCLGGVISYVVELVEAEIPMKKEIREFVIEEFSLFSGNGLVLELSAWLNGLFDTVCFDEIVVVRRVRFRFWNESVCVVVEMAFLQNVDSRTTVTVMQWYIKLGFLSYVSCPAWHHDGHRRMIEHTRHASG